MKEPNQNNAIEPLKFPAALILPPNLKTFLDIEKIDQHIESVIKIRTGLEHLEKQIEPITETLSDHAPIFSMKTFEPASFMLNRPQITEQTIAETHLLSPVLENKPEEQEKKLDKMLDIDQDLLAMLKFHADGERRKYGQSSIYEPQE